MKHSIHILSYLLPAIFRITCTVYAQDKEPEPSSEKIYTVFLLGDAGAPHFPEDANLTLLKSQLQASSPDAAFIILGDNIYPYGLPNEDHPDREREEKKLSAQLELVKAFPGRSVIIPGNHDWQQGKKEGWERVKNQGKFIEEYLDKEDVFLPGKGCPGPRLIALNDRINLIVIDFQWLIHPWDKPKESEDCESKNLIDVFDQLNSLVEQHQDQHLIVATHHPMYSYGEHGGRLSAKDFFFPLRVANSDLWIPLPLIGLAYPFYRAVVGNIQDVANPKYRAFRNVMTDAFQKHPAMVHVAGHEHSLQHIIKDSIHYVVSGSGSKTTHVKQGKYSDFARSENGFAKLDYYENGEVWLEFWSISAAHPQGKQVYRKRLFRREVKAPLQPDEYTEQFDLSDSTITVAASQRYGIGKKGRFWLGKNYRELWEAPLEVPLFDIGEEKGGLEIKKKGGGQQTVSLRLEAQDGQQYVLRSIEKYPDKAIPPLLRETFLADLVEDGISAAHPYGAFVVPDLAEAAGIYHTNPKLVYIPDDPRFGKFQKEFAGMLALFEERPDDDARGQAFFGNSEDIESTSKVLEELREDNQDLVVQEKVVRARLFDMLIGDWDRHEDQWRWAEFEVEDGPGKYYEPIPRDRDQVFFVNQGVLPKLVSRRWGVPKFEGFDARLRWAPGFNTNAIHFDRFFLNDLDWKDWQKQIDFLQRSLTDDILEKALRKWPDTVYALTAPRILKDLKARREDMERFAREYYLFLSKKVDVVGSDEKEYFLAERLNDLQTRVRVWEITKKEGRRTLMYDRTFSHNETKEVRLYGLKDEDSFEILGEADRGLKIRVIGGKGQDTLRDQSSVGGLSKKTWVYDQKGKIQMEGGEETKDKTSRREEVNEYNRKDFKYDLLLPLLSGQFNADDLLFLGGGFLYRKQGWRKEPFAQEHLLRANVAFATGAFSANYRGIFTDVLGKWDFVGDIEVAQPFAVDNFFGLGNESVYDFRNREINFYRYRSGRSRYNFTLNHNIGRKINFYVGSLTRLVNVEEQSQRFIGDPANGLNFNTVFDQHAYSGGNIGFEIDTRDNTRLPNDGIHWTAEGQVLRGLNQRSSNFSRLSTDLFWFLPAKILFKLTLANRVGYAQNFGNFEFFNANTLGGRLNLRGFRRTRFYGEKAFYHNVDLRVKLFSFASYLFPARVCVLGYHDIGRVWLDGEDSSTWHRSAGFGIWLAPLNEFVIMYRQGFTKEENLPTVSFGYQF